MRIVPMALLFAFSLTAIVQFAIAQPAPARPPVRQSRLVGGLPVESVTVVGVKPSEETIKKLAKVLGENPDVLLALAGKVSSDLREVIVKRPELFGQLIRQMKDAPEHAVLQIVREVRDGKW